MPPQARSWKYLFLLVPYLKVLPWKGQRIFLRAACVLTSPSPPHSTGFHLSPLFPQVHSFLLASFLVICCLFFMTQYNLCDWKIPKLPSGTRDIEPVEKLAGSPPFSQSPKDFGLSTKFLCFWCFFFFKGKI